MATLNHTHTWDGMIIERGEWSFDDGTKIPYAKIADGENTVTVSVGAGAGIPDDFLLVRGQVTCDFYGNARGQVKARFAGFAPYKDGK
jgi:hypothetical protein